MTTQLPLTFTNAIAGEREKPEYAMRRGVTPLVDVPRAANTDPETSHLAAARIKASGALGDQQRRVLEMVRKFPGCTSAELANAAAMAVGGDYAKLRTQYARRLPELAIHHIRRGEARLCKVTKAKCVTWWPNESKGNER